MFGLGSYLGWYLGTRKCESNKRTKDLDALDKYLNYLDKKDKEEKKKYEKSLKKYVSSDKFILENGEELFIDYGIKLIHTFGSNIPIVGFSDYRIVYKDKIFKINRKDNIYLRDIVKNNRIKFSDELCENLEDQDKLEELKKINGLKITKHKEYITEIGDEIAFGIGLRLADRYEKEIYNETSNLIENEEE